MMPNPKQHDSAMTAPFQHLNSNFQPLSNDEIEYFAGNIPLPEPNPNSQQRVLSNQGNLSAPMLTDPAWFNHDAPPDVINQGQLRAGSVTSQTNSSQSSPDMPSPDSVVQHSAQTSPQFHSAHNSDNGNFSYGPGFSRSELARVERRLGNPSAPQHLMPRTRSMASEVGFNPMVHNRIVTDSAANWMEEAPVKQTFFGLNGDSGAAQYRNVYQTNRKREFGLNGDHNEPYKINRSSQLPGTRFEGTAGAPWRGDLGDHKNRFRQYDAGVPLQWNNNKQCYEAQEHGTSDNHLPGTTPQFGEYNDYRTQYTMPRQGGTCSSNGTPKSTNISQLSTHFSDATIALHVSVESASQTGPKEQVLTGKNPQNLQMDIFQYTNNAAGNNFHSDQTNSRNHDPEIRRPTDKMPVCTQQWVPDNNDYLGLMNLDWEYPEGICNFETYSNHIGVIDPWKEVQAEREFAVSSSFAPDTPQMGNNEEGPSSSQSSQEQAEQTSRATRTLAPTEGLGLSKEAEKELVAKRAKNRGYTAKHSQKIKDIRESYKNEAELLSKKILGPRQYRANIEKNMVFAGKALKNWHPRLLGHETEGYLAGMKELRNKFNEQKNLDSELTAADQELAAQKQKFWDGYQEYEETGQGSRKSRAKKETKHWENVCNVLNLQWTLRMETKLAGLATLYVQRTIPTVISKLGPILDDVRKQCYQTEKGKKGFEDFMEFLKKHCNLFMVRRNNFPSGSTSYMRM